MMRHIFLVFSFLFINFIAFTKSDVDLDSIDYSRTGDYFPYVPLTEEDSIYYPIMYEVELFVNDLYDLDISNNFFTAWSRCN